MTENLDNQNGAALMILVFIIALFLTAYLFKIYDPGSFILQQGKKTQQSLAIAKQALLAYSAEPISASLTCGSNCPRPGDLPCPDLDNDGDAESSCNTQVSRLGRLPWKTLGIDDLRDGSGERLWYAISNRYKNNTKILPLNSDSTGGISLRNAQGLLVNDATSNNGLVGLIIAPNVPLTRNDTLIQNRNSTNQNNAIHYLDIAFSEDNANFIDDGLNGFISGKVSVGGQQVLNDIALPITVEDVNTVMENRVLAEVMTAVNDFYTVNSYYPFPAVVSPTDNTCLGNTALSFDDCLKDSTTTFGRLPVGDGSNDIWDSNSILRGEANHNWFQQNGWREQIFYAPAPACTSPPVCTGPNYLTLNNSITPYMAPSQSNKRFVLISSGRILASQSRSSDLEKLAISNYVEDAENTDSDSTYNRSILDILNNDRFITTP